MHQRLEKECSRSAHGVTKGGLTVPTGEPNDPGGQSLAHGRLQRFFPIPPSMEGLPRCIKTDDRLVVLNMQIQLHVRIPRPDIGAFSPLLSEIVGDGVFQAQGCIFRVPDLAVCGRRRNSECPLRRQKPGPVHGFCGPVEIVGAVALECQERRKDP